MNLDISKIPFSRFGSYFAISYDDKDNELYIRDLHGGDESPSKLFRLELTEAGAPQKFSLKVDETKLSLYHIEDKEKYIEICIPKYDIIRIVSKNCGIRFSMVKNKYDNVMLYDKNKLEFHSYSKEIKLMLSLIKGTVKLDAPWDMIGNTHVIMDFNCDDCNEVDMALESYKTVWKPKEYMCFLESQELVKNEYKQWKDKVLEVPEEYKSSRDLASYITWSSVVKPEGMLKRPAMYMSKNWMYNIWSWDNCFNAMALSKNNPELALDQLMIFIDHQDESGVFADFINDRYLSFSCCKPPIYGWAFRYMKEQNEYFKKPEILDTVYNAIKLNTEYWLKYRRYNEEELPFYKHGNDSGWDNSSIFHKGIPVQAPDLSAFLVKQMYILSEIAEELNKKSEAENWISEGDKLLEKLIKDLWKDNRFTAIKVDTKEYLNEGNSLILMMPIVLGDKLPKHIKEELLKELKIEGKYLSKYGLATEAMDSKYYKENGYWLGPIWAPVMMLIIDSLKECGEGEFAGELAKRFCNATLIGGMAENFDPIDGKGLVDPAFTWTSSVFLMLANKYLI
ncbi:amylo-alpha-1,6-glucosidase [Clostridium amazonitimonense]|uniref:amylo-alpha-1,6-glucosidase n=1 Tax=Clostridium amazonitimonense TaxID=1499689 RepID=UPI000509921C|nr:trehalase family glycosidase [Clostridium amazonitimonense]